MSYTQYSEYGGNPYSGGPGAEAGQATTGHLAQPSLQHEMSNYSGTSQYDNAGAPALPTSTTILSQQDFLSRVDFAKTEIRNLSKNIQDIASLHQKALSSTDNSTSAQLEDLVTRTQLKNTQIRDQIKFLEGDALKTQDGTKNVKTRQAKQLKGEFEKSLQDYKQEEVAYRLRYREQIGRQYRIVNPEATDAEVKEASEMDWGSEGVFQNALKSNRSGQATSVLGAVRARHNELQRIEATLTDLAAMFADMEQIVVVQDPIIDRADENVQKTTDDVSNGVTQIGKANDHARRRNRLKWWCLLVVVLIIIAIALGVGLGIGLTRTAAKTTTGQ